MSNSQENTWSTNALVLSHGHQEQQRLSSSTPAYLSSNDRSNPHLEQSANGWMPAEETSDRIPYGVDWSETARRTSHCWLPHSSQSSSTSRLCSYISCQKRQLTADSSFVQCPTCSLIVHSIHLSDLSANDDGIPPCRPSFTDDRTVDDTSVHDQHYWSTTPALSMPCTLCKRKSLKQNSGYSDTRVTTVAADEPTSGLVCMWCSRGYHRQCWESIRDKAGNSTCDYGEFGNIVVRPQWLHRFVDATSHFRAQIPDRHQAGDPLLTPVIFFINKLSGGQKGQQIYRTLIRLLNPRQVFLLENDSTIEQALAIYASISNARICICGGDGTVGWVLSRLVDTFPNLTNPPAAICPLGTGNDLSRVLGWGAQHAASRLFRTLAQIARADPIALDRWQIHLEPLTPSSSNNQFAGTHREFLSFREHPKFIRNADLPLYANHREAINSFFFNYISFGLDAAVVLDFHARRTRDPSEFTSPFKNKLVFIDESRKYFNEFAFGMAWNISTYIRLICDEQDFTDSLRHCHSVVLLNTRGFGAGTHPWGRRSSATNAFETQDFADGKIEVLGLNTVQMALIHLGFRGTRIAQCNRVRIELSHPMPVHMDGEPFYLPGSTAVNVTHAGQVMVLRSEQS